MNLLFVCDYNFIRSPCAEIMTKENAAQSGLELKVSSAGLQRSQVPRIKSEMCRAMEELRYPTAHTPRIVTPEIMSQQNLILCFTKEQRAILRENTDKPVFTLPEYVSWFYKEIRDPSDSMITPEPRTWLTPTYCKLTGKTDSTVYEDVLDVYLKTAKTIEKYVDKLITKLLKEQTKLMQHPQSGNMQAYSSAKH